MNRHYIIWNKPGDIMKQTDNTPRIYVGTYAKYNNGLLSKQEYISFLKEQYLIVDNAHDVLYINIEMDRIGA